MNPPTAFCRTFLCALTLVALGATTARLPISEAQLQTKVSDQQKIESAKRSKLQIQNASSDPVKIMWLNDDGDLRPSGELKPDEETIIRTTIGHVHVLVNHQGEPLARIEARQPVQTFRFQSGKQLDLASGTDQFLSNAVMRVTPEMNVPAFYSKIIFADGYPIVGSEAVDDYALLEAAYLINLMLAHREDVRQAMIASGSRLCIMSEDEFTTDLPEFQRLAKHSQIPGIDGRDFWDARARGLGGSETDPYCSCAEENLLAYDGDPYSTENILIHEFAHNIHLRGLSNIDSTFDKRLREAYKSALDAGLWKGKYASVTPHEYFAEGVQSWFNNNRENDHDHNHVNTREELIEYDPKLAALCEEVFGETKIEYTKPTTRLVDHMKDYQPQNAPKFRWPERLKVAQQAIHRDAVERNEKAQNEK